jgi:hypothetical protein
MRRWPVFVLSAAFALGLAASALSMPLPETSAEVAVAARAGLPAMLAAIPERDLAAYGFGTTVDRSAVGLGGPVEVLTLTPAEISRSAAAGDLPRTTSTSSWLIPVIAGGRTRCLLTVARMDGRLKAVAIGSAGLAAQLDALLAAYPAREGWQSAFVRVFQARADLLFVSRQGTTRVALLQSAALALASTSTLETRLTLTPQEVVERLKPVVERELTEGVGRE